MALETILGTAMTPVGVVITNSEDKSRVLSAIRVIRASVETPTETTNKPIQSSGVSSDPNSGGSVASDLAPTKVIRPSLAELECIIDSSDTISELIKWHNDPSAMFTMAIKSIYLKGMVINRVNLRYSGDHLNVSMARVSFEQAIPMPYEAQNKTEQDGDASTYGFGVQQPAGIISSVSEFFSNMAKKMGF